MAETSVDLQFDPIFGGQAVKKLEKNSGLIGTRAAGFFAREFGGALGKISPAKLGLGALGAGIVGGVLATSAIKTAASFEQINTQLITLTGSAEAANLVFQDLKEFSAGTPFQIEDIARASNKLISFGFSAGTVKDRIREIGEVAAGSGADLGELALIFGQVQAAGKLTGERLLQLQERAVPIGDAIKSVLGNTSQGIAEIVKSGQVSVKVFQQAFASLSQSGGLFEGSLQRQSQTINGILSTLQDNFKIFSAEIGKAFGPAVVTITKDLITLFQNLGDSARKNAPVISENLKKIADVLLVTPAKFWLNFLAGDANKNLTEVNAKIANLQKNIRLLNADLKVQQKSTFSKLIGADKETQLELFELEAQLKKLKMVRDQLADSTGKNSAKIREELALQAKAKQAALAQAELERNRQKALADLGNVGLKRQEIIEKNLDRELSLITEAERTGALESVTADQRRLQSVAIAEQQITAIKSQEAQQRAADRQLALEQELAAEQTLSDKLVNVSKRFSQVAKSFKITSKDIAKSLITGFGNAAGSAFAAFGAALVKGENALKAFGKAFAAAIGQAAVQLGTRFILEGIAISFSPFLGGPAVGGPLIAAGAALATFGGALGAIAGGGGGGAGGAGGANNFSPVGGDFDSPVNELSEPAEPETKVTVNISGDVFDSDETGLRISQILEEASLNQNVKVVGAA